MEKYIGCNEHTGALLVSKPANEAFNAGWERIFGKKVCCKCGDTVEKDQTSTYDGETYCKTCLEKEYLD